MVELEDSDFFENPESGLLIVLNNLHFDSLESADHNPQKNRQQNSRHLVHDVQSVHILGYLESRFSCPSLWEVEQIEELGCLENGPEEKHDVGLAEFLFHQDCLHRERAHQRHRAAHRDGRGYHNLILLWPILIAILIIVSFIQIIKRHPVAVPLYYAHLVIPKIAIGCSEISLVRHIKFLLIN